MVDSGTSFADIPATDFNNLVNMLLDLKVSCTQPADTSDFYHCISPSDSCEEAPNLELSLLNEAGETKTLLLNRTKYL